MSDSIVDHVEPAVGALRHLPDASALAARGRGWEHTVGVVNAGSIPRPSFRACA